MKSVMTLEQNQTIDSDKLLVMVNEVRASKGESQIRNNKFIEKVLDELDGEYYTKSVVQKTNKTKSLVITMTYKQALRVAARESKIVRKVLVDQIEDLIIQSFKERAEHAEEVARLAEAKAKAEEESARLAWQIEAFRDQQATEYEYQKIEFANLLTRIEKMVIGKSKDKRLSGMMEISREDAFTKAQLRTELKMERKKNAVPTKTAK